MPQRTRAISTGLAFLALLAAGCSSPDHDVDFWPAPDVRGEVAPPGAAPGEFVLVTPSHQATGVAVRPTFSWQTSLRATSFILTIHDDSDGLAGTDASLVYEVTRPWETTYRLSSELAHATRYEWRVVAINEYGEKSSNSARFTTVPSDEAVWDGDLSSLQLHDVGISGGAYMVGDVSATYSEIEVFRAVTVPFWIVTGFAGFEQFID